MIINKSLISRCLVSLISVLSTQFALSLLPLCFPNSSYFVLLPLSVVLLVVVVGLGRLCKKIAGVKASPSAFVFFTIFFTWAIYICVVRSGLCRFMSSDPGFMTDGFPAHDPNVRGLPREFEIDEEVSPIDKRAKYCGVCKSYVIGFDHHCPAFGNCVGQRNHLFFIVLLIGFVISEASFTACAYQYTVRSHILSEVDKEEQAAVSGTLVMSSMFFCIVQLIWQVPFVMWHGYCACSNIKTDEWINWSKYPEFQIKITGESETRTQFRNPYDKGVVMNLKEFLTAR